MDVVVKRKPKNTTPKRGKQSGGEDRYRTTRWVVGIILLAFGAYLFVTVLLHLFNWKSELTGDGSSGVQGAWLSSLLVGDSFGAFGVLVPVMVIVFAFRVLTKSLKFYDHTLISFALVTILGSLTLGAIFDTDYDMFNSGWGGAFGIEISRLIKGEIGNPGIVILLLLSWVLTAVFINIRVIEIVNSFGSGIANRGKGLVDKVKRHKPTDDDVYDEPVEYDPVIDEQTEPADESIGDVLQYEPEAEPYPFVDDPSYDEPIAEPESTEPEYVDPYQYTEPTVEPQIEVEPEPEPLVIEVFDPEGDVEMSDSEADHRPFDPDRTQGYYLPSVELLDERESSSEVSNDEIEENTRCIQEVLADFKIPIVNITATTGPTVTLYEVVQERGVKVAKIEGLSKEIAQALKASSVRVAPIPQSGTIGIEVPNRKPSVVSMRSALKTERFLDFKGELPVVVGRNIQNECIVFDLAKMPHLLVAGATGTGKSVGLNVILTSLLYRKDPSQLKLVLIDPKQVEFSLYEGLGSHFLARMESEDENIVIDAQKAVYTLYSLCAEMEERLKKCRMVGTRNITEYNEMVRKCKIESREIMPYIVVVIDEYADLVTQSKLVEQPVMRLAQKARAAGIHLILATQRPSVDILTGRIKTNFPARIAFRVSSRVDSMTIIDQPGANSLIGRGDMLFSEPCALTRVQCAFVDTPEVKRIVDYIASQPSPTGRPYSLPDYEESGGASAAAGGAADSGLGSESGAAMRYDALFAEIARDAVGGGDNFSVSYIQRTYEVGFVRAGRIMLQLERAGIVGPQVPGAKSRDVKIYDMPTLEAKLQELGVE